MVDTDNGFFDCQAEHADQNRLLDSDRNLSSVSYLSSDNELLIKCDENTSYMCHTLSSVNKKNMESVKILEFEILDHIFVWVARSEIGWMTSF